VKPTVYLPLADFTGKTEMLEMQASYELGLYINDMHAKCN